MFCANVKDLRISLILLAIALIVTGVGTKDVVAEKKMADPSSLTRELIGINSFIAGQMTSWNPFQDIEAGPSAYSNGRVVFQKGPVATSSIYTNMPGSGVSFGIRKGYHPAFSPDGSTIAFVDNTPGPTNGFIMLMNANGSNVRQLVHPTQGFSPTWSPDGLRMAFIRGDFVDAGDTGKGDLYVMDMTPGNEGANEVKIANALSASKPSWGTNNRIVFASRDQSGPQGIRITGPIPSTSQIASNPPSVTPISGTNLNDKDPSWSPDGSWITFISARDYPSQSDSEVYVMNPQGGAVRRVTNATGIKTGPSWSPDGKLIVFSRDGTPGPSSANLRIVNADGSNGSNPAFLTNFSSGDTFPHWGAGPPFVNLGITVNSSKEKAGEGEQFNYRVKTTNHSTATATGVRITATIPSGIEGLSIQAVPSGQCGFTSSSGIACNPLTINAGQSYEFTINVRVTRTTEGSVTATTAVTGDQPEPTPDPNSNSATADTDILSSADLAITIDAPSQAELGSTIDYKIRIENTGPSIAFGVRFTAVLPGEFNLPADIVSVPGICTRSGSQISCDLGPDLGKIEPSSARQYSIVLRSSRAGGHANFVAVVTHDTSRSYDKNPNNNQAVKNVNVVAPPIDLQLIANFANEITLGDNLVLTVNVRNNGPGPATSVRLRMQRFSGTDFISAAGPNCADTAGIVTCMIGNLGSGATSSLITLTVRPRNPGVTTIGIAADATEVEKDPDPNANSGNANVNVISRLDLIGLEVTQAVQDLSNTVPLIEGRRTMVRAFLKTPPGTSTQAEVELVGRRLTADAPEILGTLAMHNGTSTFVDEEPNRGDLHGNPYFYLPGSWTHGNTVFELRTKSGPPLRCSGTARGDCLVTVTWRSPLDLEVEFLRLDYKYNGTTYYSTDTDRSAAVDQIYALMPIRSLKWKETFVSLDPKEYGFLCARDLDRLLVMHSRRRAIDCPSGNCKKRYLAIITNAPAPNPLPSGCSLSGGGAYLGGFVGNVFGTPITDDGGTELNAAHEMGHSLNLRHTAYSNGSAASDPGAHDPSDGTISVTKFPFDHGTIFGVDLWDLNRYDPSKKAKQRVFGPSTPNFMSYGRPRKWVSELDYKRLISYLDGGGGVATTSPVRVNSIESDRSILVSGLVALKPGGVTILDPLLTFNEPRTSVVATQGSHAIRLENSAAAVLAVYPFIPEVGSDGIESVNGSFAMTIPLAVGTARISLVKGDEVLATMAASLNPPQVTLQSPNGGETLNGSNTTVSWTASDADPGDALTYVLQYSGDGGNTWMTLVTDWTESSYELNLKNLPKTSSGLLRVTVSDGFNSASDQSNAVFTVTGHAPEPSIKSPGDTMTFVADQSINLEGEAYDVEDGVLENAYLKWTSHLNGDLGTGRSLSVNAAGLQEGDHTITLRGTDSDGRFGTASVSIKVARTAPVLPPTLVVESAPLFFSAKLAGPMTTEQSIGIRNGGTGDLSWSAVSDQPWLKLTGSSGNAPADLRLTVDPAGLAEGDHAAKVTISSVGPNAGSQEVNVYASVVQGPPIRAEGRVLTSGGRGLSGADVSIVDADGVTRSTLTSSAGYFSFSDLPSGKSYTIRISSKRYRFSPRTMILADNVTFEDFVGVE